MPSDFDWYLLIGDAPALPAIARRLEALGTTASVRAVLLVSDAAEEAYLQDTADRVTWVHTSGDSVQDLQQILRALTHFANGQGDGFVWIGAEASIAAGVYQHVVTDLQQPKEWIKAAAYWSANNTDASETIS